MKEIQIDTNTIKYSGNKDITSMITFLGGGNIVSISNSDAIYELDVKFCGNNGYLSIGDKGNIKAKIIIGDQCRVILEDFIYTTQQVVMTTAESTEIRIGNGCMIASGVYITTHDQHPIYDVNSWERINISKNVIIKDHVWLCDHVRILKGTYIISGCVIGYGSIVTGGNFSNNYIIAGVPARIVKKNIVWEHPHLTYDRIKNFDENGNIRQKTLKFWNKTKEIL